MKTKLIVTIIIGIVLASIGSGAFAYYIQVQSECESILGDTHYPRPLTLWNCLDYLKMIEENPEPEPDVIKERFHGLTKSQIEDIQLAELGCKKIGNQTYCDIMVQEKINYYLQQNQ